MKNFRKRKDVNSVGFRNDKIFNAPPSDFSIQEVPRSLKEFVQLKESIKNSENDKLKKFPKVQSSTNPAKRNPSVSKQSVTSNSEHQTIRADIVQRRNNSKQKKKLKLMKLKDKRKNKELLKLENLPDVPEFVKDDIKFGEVVHRPPALSVLPRKVALSAFHNRPGRKDDLLLKSLLKRKHSK